MTEFSKYYPIMRNTAEGESPLQDQVSVDDILALAPGLSNDMHDLIITAITLNQVMNLLREADFQEAADHLNLVLPRWNVDPAESHNVSSKVTELYDALEDAGLLVLLGPQNEAENNSKQKKNRRK